MEKKKLLLKDFGRMNYPRRLWGWDWSRVPDGAKDRVQKFCENLPEQIRKGLVLLLVGNVGVGKSTIAAIIGGHAKRLRLSVYYTTLLRWREGRRENEEFDEGQSVSARMRSVDVLLLDDCRAHTLADTSRTYWYDHLKDLVSERTLDGKATVLVCQFEAENPILQWTTGEMTRCVGIRVDGPNQHVLDNQKLAADLFD